MQDRAKAESEKRERKAPVSDAHNATRAAVEEGIIAGGGVALSRTHSAIEALKLESHDEQTGVDIVRRAVEAPLRELASKPGLNGSLIAQEAKRRHGQHR